MKLYKSLTILLLSLCSAVQAQTITLEDCREMAIENSLMLKSSKEKIYASKDMLKAYNTNKLPNLSLSAGYVYSTASFSETISGGYLPTFIPTSDGLAPNIVGSRPDGSYAYMPDITFNFEVSSALNAGLQMAQPIYMGGKISTAIKLAQLGVDAAQTELTRTEADVILSADNAFYTYIKVEEMLRSADTYKTAVDEFYRQVKSMLDRGMCTKNDLMKVQVKVNEAELNQMKAKNGLNLARMNLCYVIGLPISTLSLDVADSFNLLQNINTDLDITNRPEALLLHQNLKAKELEVKLAQSDFLPSVSALANYSYVNGLKLNGESLFGSTPSFMGGITINVPIFHWGEGRRKVSSARHEVTIAENNKADLEQRMTLELMQSINSYHEAQAEVTMMERNLEQTEENRRQSEKQYKIGMEPISNYLEAQALWQKAMSDLVEAKSNQRMSYARYCRSRGDK